MNCNTQNAKIASITEKTLIVGIDVGSETHYARAFDWRNYEYTRKPLEFSNTEAGFQTFKAWMEDMILSILVDTFFTRISMPKLQLPESRNISAA